MVVPFVEHAPSGVSDVFQLSQPPSRSFDNVHPRLLADGAFPYTALPRAWPSPTDQPAVHLLVCSKPGRTRPAPCLPAGKPAVSCLRLFGTIYARPPCLRQAGRTKTGDPAGPPVSCDYSVAGPRRLQALRRRLRSAAPPMASRLSVAGSGTKEIASPPLMPVM